MEVFLLILALIATNVALVTGYSTKENLTGCYAPGKCRTACGTLLDDRKLTVAAHPKWGLGCGAKLMFCYRKKCAKATVTDRTASFYDFEFSYALTQATGMNPSNWASPRKVTWVRLYRKG